MEIVSYVYFHDAWSSRIFSSHEDEKYCKFGHFIRSYCTENREINGDFRTFKCYIHFITSTQTTVQSYVCGRTV